MPDSSFEDRRPTGSLQQRQPPIQCPDQHRSGSRGEACVPTQSLRPRSAEQCSTRHAFRSLVLPHRDAQAAHRPFVPPLEPGRRQTDEGVPPQHLAERVLSAAPCSLARSGQRSHREAAHDSQHEPTWAERTSADQEAEGGRRASVEGAPTKRHSPRSSLALRSCCCSTPPLSAGVILAGRATSVPFTAVLTGLQRTTTDNAKAASTCAASCLCR
jgi:hypothetical protein